jgi:hypothetical protein
VKLRQLRELSKDAIQDAIDLNGALLDEQSQLQSEVRVLQGVVKTRFSDSEFRQLTDKATQRATNAASPAMASENSCYRDASGPWTSKNTPAKTVVTPAFAVGLLQGQDVDMASPMESDNELALEMTPFATELDTFDSSLQDLNSLLATDSVVMDCSLLLEPIPYENALFDLI